MKIDAQTFLRLTENANTLAFVDIEATGLKGDYNSVLLVSFLPYGEKPYTLMAERPGNDKSLMKAVKEELEKYDCWCTYYGKGFDIPQINTRLLQHRMYPVAKRPHLDMYWMLKSKLLTARKSQAHLLNWLGTPEQKMGVSAEEWNKVLTEPDRMKGIMRKRCESDVLGLRDLYKRTKHLAVDITT